MARNHEKNLGQLNRWWLHYVRKDVGKKERRPRLEHLKTAAEIRKWLPLIKEEMEFCLTDGLVHFKVECRDGGSVKRAAKTCLCGHLFQQSQVPCYTDGKVDEYRRKLMYLEVEYKNFVRKLRRLDATATLCEPSVRPYQRKRLCEVPLSMHPVTDVNGFPEKFEPIRLPVLEHEGNQPILEHHVRAVWNESEDLNPQYLDKPLTFKSSAFNDEGKQILYGSKPQNPLYINYSSSGEED